jgi:hypothetical protein
MCEVKGCLTIGCRRQSHHGRTGTAVCTHCGAGASLNELSFRDLKKGEAAPAILMGTHRDWSHALGLTCGTCGLYFVPVDTPRALLDSAEPWETDAPGRNRKPRKSVEMQNALADRMVDWNRRRHSSAHPVAGVATA